ncbi:MAG: DUF2961 domain-containing protein [Planctomycetes bacterium]|nr:DUF2961 domain-containing protein [Planctomycetota bacterium]
MLTVWIATWLCLAGPVDDPPVVRAEAALVDLWDLARPRDWEVFQDSSFDRTGGNDDGFSGRYGAVADRTGALVLFDHDGPGAITRIWSANPHEDCWLEFFFDGESEPRIRTRFAAVFGGFAPGFVRPFVDDAHGGFVAYVPIPYAKHLRVVATGPLYFWQITAARFPAGSDVVSFDPDATRTDVLTGYVERVTRAQAAEHFMTATPLPAPGDVGPIPTRKAFATADGRPIPTFAPVQFPCSLGHDQAVALELEGPAVVTSLRMHVEAEGSRFLRTTLVRVFVDDDSEPWVEAPLGDLFALVDAKATTRALPFVASPPEYELRFVQPFARSLRVHVIQTGDEALRVDASAIGVRGPIDAFGAHRFFARWQRTLTRRGEPLVLLDARGSGHVVGVTYLGNSAGGITYLEGDEAIAIDGRPATAYHGTGTEDFFDSGWYWRAGPFQTALFGLTHKDEAGGSIATYRMFTTTAIPFRESMRFTLEHGGGNDAPYVEIATVTYGYACIGTTLGLPRVDARDLVPPRKVIALPAGAIAFESLDGAKDAVFARIEDLAPTHAGPRVAVATKDRPFECDLDVAVSDRVRATLLVATTTGSGSMMVDGLGFELAGVGYGGTQRGFVPMRSLSIGETRVDAGEQRIRIAPTDGEAYLLGILLEPARDFVREFDVAGPFALEDGAAFTRALGREDGSGEGWSPRTANADGYVDLRASTASQQDLGEHSVAFVRFVASAPTVREVTLRLGSDDGLAVFVNGAEVFRRQVHRGAAPDQDLVPIALRAGSNTIVLKVANDDGGFGAYVRISDPQEGLAVGR